jgi:signal transduction histidine kinase
MIGLSKKHVATLCLIFILPVKGSAFGIAGQTNTIPNRQSIDSLLLRAESLLYSMSDSAYKLAREVVQWAKQADYPLAQANGYRLQGSYFSDIKSNSGEALRLFHLADSIYRLKEERGFVVGVGSIYHNIGTIRHREGNYIEAISYYSKAIEVLEPLGNKTILPLTYNNISILYAFIREFAKAEQYSRACLNIAQAGNSKRLLSMSYITLADALIEQGKFNDVPEILSKALALAKEENNLYFLELSHYNMANYYGLHKKDYRKAIEELILAREYADQLGSQWEQTRVLTNLAEFYSLNNQFDEAKTTARAVIEPARHMGAKDVQQRALSVLARAEASTGNYRAAYDYLSESMELKDTVFSESSKRHIDYLESVYQSEKKQKEIYQLQSVQRANELLLRKRSYLIAILSVSIILIISLFVLVYSRVKDKQLIHEQRIEIQDQLIKKLEQEKQLAATHALLQGETTERIRLSRDLHDGLGGMLSVIKLKMSNMKGGLTIPEEYVGNFNAALEMLDGSIRELRRVAHNLMPESLLKYGLNPAIADFCGGIDKLTYHFFGTERRLDDKLEITIYRIAHELVNNALKHAEANHINVQLILENDRVCLIVHDDGKGFDPTQVDPARSGGLQNIRSRVNSFGGRWDLISAPGKGTEVTVEFAC